MVARTILVLSCLLSTRVLAQAPPDFGGDAAGVNSAAASSSDAPASATSSAGVGASDSASTPEPKPTESVQAAVPVDREALAPATAEQVAPRSLESDPMFTPAVVLIGTGGAALLASLFTGLGAHGIYRSLELDCKNDICSSDKQKRINSGKALATVSTVLTGAGIIAAGIGTTLLVLAATREDKPPTSQSNFGFAKLQLTSGPTPLGIGAAGSF